jgi:homopolymeric O-antigen transport system ATP-binding protein
MSKTVISAEGLGKSYMIGHQQKDSHSTLRDMLTNLPRQWWSRLRNPHYHTHENIEEFWALKDVGFEIKQGDRVGVIGRNGAGKSTLLKILSRITEPTTGRAKISGRVASLLEVGTGFHSELTGRENIFLNGAILGMSRAEVKNKFDEIVAFAEVEKFLDTPVKRYSSGMYVRLAFAIAAHLEPEILIVDEVLAVGDVAFQNKCLGKMEDAGKEGRTVVFVSHNMAAITRLCSQILLLKKGNIEFRGEVNAGINKYLRQAGTANKLDFKDMSNHIGALSFSRFTSVKLFDLKDHTASEFKVGDGLRLKIEFELFEDIFNLELGFGIFNVLGIRYSLFIAEWEGLPIDFKKGHHQIICDIPSLPYLPGKYGITPWIKRRGMGLDDQVPFAAQLTLMNVDDITNSSADLDRYNVEGVYVKSTWSLSNE